MKYALGGKASRFLVFCLEETEMLHDKVQMCVVVERIWNLNKLLKYIEGMTTKRQPTLDVSVRWGDCSFGHTDGSWSSVCLLYAVIAPPSYSDSSNFT